MPALSWQLLPTAPRIITWPHPWEKRYFRHAIFDLAAVRRFMEVPGRGLEPLRISPPDPKSGASANFATLASCDGHEGRFVGRVRANCACKLPPVPATNRRMPAQELARPVFLPVIIGTPRQGRLTEPAANFVFGEASKRSDIETELIDIRKIPIRMDDAGEALKDSQFCATVERADGLIIVAPEYNHSFPGLLKHVLDTNLKEYIHKAVGVCGVSAGPFGGARMIQSLLPVLRELGLVTIFSDVYFGTAGKLFDPATGKITDPAYTRRVEKFLDELVWMARALRYARENIPAP